MQIESCVDLALRCADSGFAMVTFGEQHFNNYEPYSNPFMMGAHLAPNLGETWFGTTVVPLPFHQPMRLAEDSNLLDLLLRGRFIMGMSAGRGAPFPDFANFGLEASERLDIFASKLEFLQRAAKNRAGDDPIVMDTKWDRGALTGRMMPLSWRQGGTQLAVATVHDDTIDDIARKGLPLFLSPSLIGTAAQKFARHQSGLERAGLAEREREDIRWKSLVTRHVVVGSTEDEAWEAAETLTGRNPMMDRSSDTRSLQELSKVDPEAILDRSDENPRNSEWVQSWIIAGTPDSVAEQLAAYEGVGIPHVNIRFNPGMARLDLVEQSFNLFRAHVLPQIDSERFPALRHDEVEPIHMSEEASVPR